MEKNILSHLSTKKNYTDDLEGIVLFIYELEIKVLSKEVLLVIRELLSKGLIKELKNSAGHKMYQLSTQNK